MAGTFVAVSSSLQLDLISQIPTSKRRTNRLSLRASISEKPPSKVAPSESVKLQLREIPGNYGVPIITPMKDRFDYFYNQGRDEFFKSRIQKYKSTVFRTNMPPGPFISSNPNVVVLLDAKSFPVLFDVTKVEKKDLLTGTYMPSTELTGGYRVLSYLDPSEPSHSKLKRLIFFLLKASRDRFVPEFQLSYGEMFDSMEKDLASKGKAGFSDANNQAAFNFLARALHGVNPSETELGVDGPKLINKWVLCQLGPLLTLGLPKFIEDFTIHTFRIPPWLIKRDYKRLYDFFYDSSEFVFAEADNLGISRDEACHNLIFATCFNAFSGMKIFFPNMLKWVGRAGFKLHARLADEIRTVIKSNGGKVTMAAIERMPLVKSVVYEALRIEPPVPSQYGKAKKDMIIESHNNSFEVKAGEILFGFQPFATKDPKVFDRPEEFVADRFVGEQGEDLLKYILWSNGPESQSTTIGNKQCAGKDFVVMASRMLLVEVFSRFDSFEIEVAKSPLGVAVTITSLKRAGF